MPHMIGNLDGTCQYYLLEDSWQRSGILESFIVLSTELVVMFCAFAYSNKETGKLQGKPA